MNKDLKKELKKFTKDEIITALSEVFFIDRISSELIDNLYDNKFNKCMENSDRLINELKGLNLNKETALNKKIEILNKISKIKSDLAKNDKEIDKVLNRTK